ncbi:unnamed protein product [Ceratitis capitata]|uniref:(Mediterranean fruit fly) hypothetical protein n=1 Tax=Ceratitis capitata TaxID=7213 RepID=A0A811V8D9_CERCA|nr:unnamed protein product [Ceratitis capitata]
MNSIHNQQEQQQHPAKHQQCKREHTSFTTNNNNRITLLLYIKASMSTWHCPLQAFNQPFSNPHKRRKAKERKSERAKEEEQALKGQLVRSHQWRVFVQCRPPLFLCVQLEKPVAVRVGDGGEG